MVQYRSWFLARHNLHVKLKECKCKKNGPNIALRIYKDKREREERKGKNVAKASREGKQKKGGEKSNVRG